jgi:hypothetical protein
MSKGPAPRSNRERFDEKWELNPETGCWIWIAGRRRGYGVFNYRWGVGRSESIKAPRAALLIYGDGIPDGRQALHYCGRKLCVRVDDEHVYPGTYGDNLRDGYRLGERVPPPTQGELNGNARLTAVEARAIRDLKGQRSVYAIASEFGVSRPTVSAIWTGRLWSHA